LTFGLGIIILQGVSIRALSNVQYGCQVDILDFVFQTLTAERVTGLISYFCGTAGWVGERALSISGTIRYSIGCQADILDFVFWTANCKRTHTLAIPAMLHVCLLDLLFNFNSTRTFRSCMCRLKGHAKIHSVTIQPAVVCNYVIYVNSITVNKSVKITCTANINSHEAPHEHMVSGPFHF
jgi:hypothetical protein